MLRPLLSLAFAGFVVAALGGCAHYQLGTGGTPAFRTLFVEPVGNKTLLPQAQALLSTHLRETFARDARVQLVNSAAGADATLALTVDSYRREIAAVREGDTGLARKFNVTLGATGTLRDNRSGRAVFENRPLTGVTCSSDACAHVCVTGLSRLGHCMNSWCSVLDAAFAALAYRLQGPAVAHWPCGHPPARTALVHDRQHAVSADPTQRLLSRPKISCRRVPPVQRAGAYLAPTWRLRPGVPTLESHPGSPYLHRLDPRRAGTGPLLA